jgi:hypothetical protein|tara:strand:+ start:2215 stop:2703 length:489 start_codon:yes stop_codon:yes gene_type:complete
MAEYKPYEAPQHMQDYAEKALDPFGNSMLGQNLNDKEVRLKEQTEANEEQAYWNNFINQGGSQQGEEMPNPDVMDKVLDEGVNWGGQFKYPVKTGLGMGMKGLMGKLGPKAAQRLAGYSVPYAGWAMAAADAVDYFGYPIYDHLPGGEYLSWRNTEKQQGEE